MYAAPPPQIPDIGGSNMDQTASEKRVYQAWKGSNKFFFGGRFIFGPDVRSLLLTFVLILVPVTIFCVFVARKLLDKFSHHAGVAIMVIAVVFTIYVWLYNLGVGSLRYEVEKVCDGSGEDPSCSRSVSGNSIADHLQYYGVSLQAESWGSCGIPWNTQMNNNDEKVEVEIKSLVDSRAPGNVPGGKMDSGQHSAL